jgi:hypothetical protein
MNEPYDNTNTGALFANDKEGNEKRPDYKGKLDIDGVQYRISGWIRTPKSGGKKYMSLKAEPFEQQAPKMQAKPAAPSAKPIIEDEDDDIPF